MRRVANCYTPFTLLYFFYFFTSITANTRKSWIQRAITHTCPHSKLMHSTVYIKRSRVRPSVCRTLRPPHEFAAECPATSLPLLTLPALYAQHGLYQTVTRPSVCLSVCLSVAPFAHRTSLLLSARRPACHYSHCPHCMHSTVYIKRSHVRPSVRPSMGVRTYGQMGSDDHRWKNG